MSRGGRPGARVRQLVFAAMLIAIIGATVLGTLASRLHLMDVRVPVFAIGALVAAPAWVVLALAARARGTPWRWLGFAAAWGTFTAGWISLTAESLLGPVYAGIADVTAFLGRSVTEVAPAAVIAPLVEEPAKLVGAWIVLAAARRAGASPTVALGAAIGGLMGLAFGLGEAAHHLGEIVNDMGYTDTSGAFVVDWGAVRRILELQLVTKLVLGGLTNHALFSALGGAGIALLFQARRRAAVGCFVVSLAAHAMLNSVGVLVGAFLLSGLIAGADALASDDVGFVLSGWLAAFGAFLVAEGWAAVLFIRFLRREGRPSARPALAVG